MSVRWFPEAEWRYLQSAVPIACVDVLPIQFVTDGNGKSSLGAVGLIFRDTPHQGKRWCLVGGRLARDERLADAISRQIQETLGAEVQFQIATGGQPHYVAEYFTVPTPDGCFDPRQHAIGLTYCIPIKGKINPQGEAIAFSWFDPLHLPKTDEFGFNQDRVVALCLRRLKDQDSAFCNPV